MQTLSLDGMWALRPADFGLSGLAGLAQVAAAADGWLPAQVPGEGNLDLLRAGQMPEPSLSTNMPDCRWPETRSWWYRTAFNLDKAFLAHERQQLIFDGLDLNAQVFLNGQPAGEAANAFVPHSFDVRGLVRAGENEVVVRLTAGSELAQDAAAHPEQHLASNETLPAPGEIPNPMQPGDITGHRLWGGRKWLRKPQFSYGWDWVDALPNIGIWRGVRLEGHRHARLSDVRLDTRLEGGQARLELAAVIENLHAWSERAAELVLEVQPPNGGAPIRRSYPLALQPGRNALADEFEITEPQFWWPNGMGAQPLYAVTASLRDAAGALCDQRSFNIGLRTIEIDRAPLPEGSRFAVTVNGQVVFCHGVNIGPHDAILARVTDEKYRALVAEAAAAHVNMIRINGCSIYESPAFYDACDRAGILVWQDFMLTVANYPTHDPDFYANVRYEAETIVPLLRHHASLALWCGDNETVWVFAEYARRAGGPTNTLGIDLCTQLFPEICQRLDPRRPYWVSCPSGGEYPNSELEGDCHWWWPAFMHPEMSRRIRHEVFDECRARFVSEYGVLGPPHIDSMHAYLRPDELHPGSAGWQRHTNMFEKETMPAAIRYHYAEPEGLSVEDYVLYGQLFQAGLHGHIMEALRFRKDDPVDDCQGALIWSFSDCWGETGWSILDYYLRRKASYYAFRRASAPLKVIVRQRGEQLVTRLINDTRQAFSGTVEAGWWRVDGSAQETSTQAVRLAANAMQPITSAALPAAGAARDPREWLYAAVLRDGAGQALDQSIWTLQPQRALALAAPRIEVRPLQNGQIEVSSPVYCHAVHVEDHGHALLSDNWFDLLPGVPLRVRMEAAGSVEAGDFMAVGGR
jgi:beta-mannosidase